MNESVENIGIYKACLNQSQEHNKRLYYSIRGMFELSSTNALTELINALEREIFIINSIGMVRIVGMSKETVDIEEVHLGMTDDLPILDLPEHIKLLIIKQLDK